MWGEIYGTAGQPTDDNTIRLMRIACWITKSTDKHSLILNKHNYCLSTATLVTRTRHNIACKRTLPVSLQQQVVGGFLINYTDTRLLTTGIRSEKYVVGQFRRCAKVIECTYTNLDSTV